MMTDSFNSTVKPRPSIVFHPKGCFEELYTSHGRRCNVQQVEADCLGRSPVDSINVRDKDFAAKAVTDVTKRDEMHTTERNINQALGKILISTKNSWFNFQEIPFN